VPADKTKINQLYPTIGTVDGRPILRWDPASQCSDKCVVYDDCPYQKKGRCKLEQTYMNNIFLNLINPDPNRGIGDHLNDIELQRVGIGLIPLYHQLIRMKKEAYAVEQISHTNKQGSIKIHPVFAEIREIIRCIGKEIRDLKINEKWEKKYGATGAMNLGTGVGIDELMERGDPSFYEKLEKDG